MRTPDSEFTSARTGVGVRVAVGACVDVLVGLGGAVGEATARVWLGLSVGTGSVGVISEECAG